MAHILSYLAKHTFSFLIFSHNPDALFQGHHRLVYLLRLIQSFTSSRRFILSLNSGQITERYSENFHELQDFKFCMFVIFFIFR